MNAPNQNQQNQGQHSNQPTDNDPSERGLDDDTWYTARCTKIGMGATGNDKDQVILHLEIDPGDGRWIQMSKYNDISTPQGREITMGHVRAFGCQGFKPSAWQASIDRNARPSVLLKTTEYNGVWTQKIERINARKPEYSAEVIAAKEVDLESLFMEADKKRLEYLENKALGQMAGNRGGGGGRDGRSTSLPADPGDAAGRADFGREPEGNAQPFGGGQAPANGGRRARF